MIVAKFHYIMGSARPEALVENGHYEQGREAPGGAVATASRHRSFLVCIAGPHEQCTVHSTPLLSKTTNGYHGRKAVLETLDRIVGAFDPFGLTLSYINRVRCADRPAPALSWPLL